MVGHPGETEEDFEELKEFVRKARFDRMGAFAYSEEEGTYAAQQYEDSIPQEVKQARLDELMAVSYTHLDVYKRQVQFTYVIHSAHAHEPNGSRIWNEKMK